MEMNTRLQVEHPVTEEIYSADLVEMQLRIAAGEREPWPTVLRPLGHSIEARIYAEDPAAGFLPTGGRIHTLRLPPDVRVDSGVAEGGTVGSDYDPMLAKVIVWADDRPAALRKLDAALRDTVLLGVGTNIGFLRALLADPDVRAGRLDTGLVGRRVDALATAEAPPDVLPAAAVHALAELEPTGAVVDPFDVPGGWRVGAPAWTTWRMALAGQDPVEVRAHGRAADAVVEVRPPTTLRTEPGRSPSQQEERHPAAHPGRCGRPGASTRTGSSSRSTASRAPTPSRRTATRRTGTHSGWAATASPGPSANRARSMPWPRRRPARAARCARRCRAR